MQRRRALSHAKLQKSISAIQGEFSAHKEKVEKRSQQNQMLIVQTDAYQKINEWKVYAEQQESELTLTKNQLAKTRE